MKWWAHGKFNSDCFMTTPKTYINLFQGMWNQDSRRNQIPFEIGFSCTKMSNCIHEKIKQKTKVNILKLVSKTLI